VREGADPGDSLLHFDPRFDNVLIDENGTARLVDWGRACPGPVRAFATGYARLAERAVGLKCRGWGDDGRMELVAFVPSVDLDRARAFYEGRLGLTVTEITPYALVLRSGPVALRVTRVEQLTPQPFTVLGWAVDDVHESIDGLGLGCLRFEGMEQDGDGVWTTPGGDMVAWFKDPDGNTLSLTQHQP
jgi:catechol 2,3-dioxygenase-like lactoylglutathione lyase family enzyme